MNKFKSYPWLLAVFVVALLAGFILTPTYSTAQAQPTTGTKLQQKHEAKQADQQAPRASADAENDLKERVKALEEKERQTYTLLLEDQRKKIDWWFAYLAVFTAVAGIGGALIPFLIGRKDKEAIEADMRVIQADKDAIHAEKQTIEAHTVESETLRREMQEIAAHIKNLETEGAKGVDAIQAHLKILNDSAPAGTQSPLSKTEKTILQAAVQAVENSKELSFADQLLARAVDAESKDDYAKAKDCWTLLTKESPDNARAWFGLGYALQSLAKDAAEKSLPLLKEAGIAYEKTLSLKPNEYWAANNWGSALADEARAIASTDLPAARTLWQQACERYAQALTIKPDMHEAANNWGSALLFEHLAIKEAEPEKTATLLAMAKEKCTFAEKLRPGYSAYNLACIASQQGEIQDCIQWLEVSSKAEELPPPDHLRKDSDLDPIRKTPEFKNWWGKNFGPDEPIQ